MKTQLLLIALLVSLGAAVVGCSSSVKPGADAKSMADQKHSHAQGAQADNSPEAAEIKKAMAELSDADRKLAQAQRLCPVLDESALGSMGKPFKIMVDGKPVFLCCEACKDQALADAKATLAKVDQLKQGPSKTAK